MAPVDQNSDYKLLHVSGSLVQSNTPYLLLHALSGMDAGGSFKTRMMIDGKGGDENGDAGDEEERGGDEE